jgi:citrate lyase subunit beta/citryl-CoA lyase
VRSWLFVPGDRPERMEKALGLGADALILDLEDSVAPAAKPEARAAIAAFLRGRRAGGPRCFVRINPFGSGLTEDDLAAIVPARPDGLVLPKAEGAPSIAALVAQAPGLPILPIATETPAAMFTLGDYASCAIDLAGLTWGAEDLPAAIGATASREADGSYTAPYQVARAFVLFGAAAAGVAPIETVYPNIKDEAGLRRIAEAAARDGFTGMMAIHPAQVPIINAAFTPSAEAVAAARAIVDAFAANPGAGVLKVGGKMIDAPHLKQAERLLARAG